MKKVIIILILTGALFFPDASGQVHYTNTSVILEKLFSRLIASNEDAERIQINDSIDLIIQSYAGSDTVFNHKFTNLRYLGQITSRNSQLKIITWNLVLKDSISRYYCYLIHNSGKRNLAYRLEGVYREGPVRTDTVYSDKNWYGALYYDLRPFKKDDQTNWVLLGIDYGNQAITRKIIDVLSFASDGSIILGKKIFATGEALKYREVLEYGSEAVISLKFLTDKSIVFDHLVPVSPALKGKKEYYGPDFSYDAYGLEKGTWKFKSNVDVKNKK